MSIEKILIVDDRIVNEEFLGRGLKKERGSMQWPLKMGKKPLSCCKSSPLTWLLPT